MLPDLSALRAACPEIGVKLQGIVRPFGQRGWGGPRRGPSSVTTTDLSREVLKRPVSFYRLSWTSHADAYNRLSGSCGAADG